MKRLALIIIAIILLAPFVLFVGEQNIRSWPHRQAAWKIPKYENAQTWSVGASCSDLGGGGPCSAEIRFKTEDDIETVFSYYQSTFTSLGWRVTLEEGHLKDFNGNDLVDKAVGYGNNEISAGLYSRLSKNKEWNYEFHVHAK